MPKFLKSHILAIDLVVQKWKNVDWACHKEFAKTINLHLEHLNCNFSQFISLRGSYCDGVWYLMILFEQVWYLMILFEQVYDNENIQYRKVDE
jgi:hypothetical protein